MANQELQTVDPQARVTLPATFADAKVIVEILGPSEVRIRRAGEPADKLSALPESHITVLSDQDRDRFLELLESPPPANPALRSAMAKRP